MPPSYPSTGTKILRKLNCKIWQSCQQEQTLEQISFCNFYGIHIYTSTMKVSAWTLGIKTISCTFPWPNEWYTWLPLHLHRRVEQLVDVYPQDNNSRHDSGIDAGDAKELQNTSTMDKKFCFYRISVVNLTGWNACFTQQLSRFHLLKQSFKSRTYVGQPAPFDWSLIILLTDVKGLIAAETNYHLARYTVFKGNMDKTWCICDDDDIIMPWKGQKLKGFARKGSHLWTWRDLVQISRIIWGVWPQYFSVIQVSEGSFKDKLLILKDCINYMCQKGGVAMKLKLFWCQICFQAFKLLASAIWPKQRLTSINSNQQLIFFFPLFIQHSNWKGHDSYTGV